MKNLILIALLLLAGTAQAKFVTCKDQIESITILADGTARIWPSRYEEIELLPTHPEYYKNLGILYSAMNTGKTVVYTSDNGETYSNKCRDANETLFPLFSILRVY
ncbi:hypothetical protein CWB73_09490 [Pseudoalteromonas phenolica]|uniref:Uncharacterized protein n=1 Tax=Pseudoalteromonas phenolica TaxID=161398 RepID=A0A5S3YVA1_9GAMM|nr:hypothetical protein [Pseudoalteromonas phenolica]TMN92922.1 hypothetical protein CWB72_03260 [Pseudoalteromonas phenolica]TMP81073.1 hypothetical protein CWB73_09490 [Pseudoalteromonas phenolica]